MLKQNKYTFMSREQNKRKNHNMKIGDKCSKYAIAELAQPLNHGDISNTVNSKCA
jgi:hypothetical protein